MVSTFAGEDWFAVEFTPENRSNPDDRIKRFPTRSSQDEPSDGVIKKAALKNAAVKIAVTVKKGVGDFKKFKSIPAGGRVEKTV